MARATAAAMRSSRFSGSDVAAGDIDREAEDGAAPVTISAQEPGCTGVTADIVVVGDSACFALDWPGVVTSCSSFDGAGGTAVRGLSTCHWPLVVT